MNKEDFQKGSILRERIEKLEAGLIFTTLLKERLQNRGDSDGEILKPIRTRISAFQYKAGVLGQGIEVHTQSGVYFDFPAEYIIELLDKDIYKLKEEIKSKEDEFDKL